MPRRPSAYPTTRLEILMPEALRLKAELYLPRDGITGKTAYGAWSQYIIRLINEDLNRIAQRGDFSEEQQP